jgi:hypothetical protein
MINSKYLFLNIRNKINQRFKILILLVLILVLFVGCKNNQALNGSSQMPELELDNDKIIEEINTINDKVDDDSKEVIGVDEATTELNIPEEEEFYSKTTGLPIALDDLNKRPIAVMFDNHYKARLQSGLSHADIIYEVLAEGLITRYMGIFQEREPEVVGPVRSARPYFIQLALSYDPLYVHVGGSDQAFIDIKRYKMADVDGLSVGSGVYYRTQHKSMPHNMYTSYEGIIKEQTRRNYNQEVTYEGLSIQNFKSQIKGTEISELKVVYKPISSKDSTGYIVDFKYDEEAKHFKRYINGQAHTDETTAIHLYADNILVLKAKHQVLDSAGRRQIDVVGSGEGYYYNEGMYIPIKWEKEDVYSATKYFDLKGHEFKLNPGISWIQIIPLSTDVQMK